MKPSRWVKNPAFIENEVIMGRQAHRGSFLILEGEDDSRFWDHRVSQECELRAGHRRRQAECRGCHRPSRQPQWRSTGKRGRVSAERSAPPG